MGKIEVYFGHVGLSPSIRNIYLNAFFNLIKNLQYMVSKIKYYIACNVN